MACGTMPLARLPVAATVVIAPAEGEHTSRRLAFDGMPVGTT
jgi:hypothetical protein